MSTSQISNSHKSTCRVAVIWIDWYPYHLARFKGLQDAFGANGEVTGIELVGGHGVHKGFAFREDLSPDLPIQTLRPKGSWHTTSKIGLAISLWRRLSILKPAVVLVPGYYTLPAIAAAVWARMKGRGSVLMTETTAVDHVRTAWKEKLKSKLIRSMFDWAVTGGAAHVRYLQQLGFSDDRIAHFYDVVGNERVHQNTAALRNVSSAAAHDLPQKYFLFVGRLAEEKNVEGLVRGWMEYRTRGGTWSLVIAGDGPESARLKDLVHGSAYSGHVALVGHKNSRELLPLFAFASCFVLPSTREPWGLVVNEAMASSLPLIVSTRCGCAEDLVQHGVNGFLFDPEQQEDFIHCLQSTEALSDEELRRRGALSASRVSIYSPHNFGEEIARAVAWAEARQASHARSHRPTPVPTSTAQTNPATSHNFSGKV